MRQVSPSTIVIINDNAHVTGGADKIALRSAMELARRGKTVHLLTAMGPVAEELQGVPGLHVLCTNQLDLLSDPRRGRAAIQGLWNRVSHTFAEELFAGLDPQTTVVHLHLWAKALSSSVVQAALSRRFKLVCTLHDYLTACPTGTLFNHPRQVICPLPPMSARCIATQCDSRNYGHKLWRVARQGIQAQLGGIPQRLNAFITLTDHSEAILRPWLPESARRYRVSNFVDISRQPPAPIAENSLVAFSGRFVREKGPVLLARAAAMAGVTPVFIGTGPEENAIKAACPSAIVTGWLDHQQTLAWLSQARCLVLPSLWYEAQPLVVLEALALGVPCIVPDASAAREMISDGESGLIFKYGSVEDLARTLQVMKDAPYAAALGQVAYRRYWEQPQTVERHVSELLRVYGDILDCVPPGACAPAEAALYAVH